MKNRDYWEKRAVQRKLQAERQAVKTAGEMLADYDRAAAAIRKDIGYWLGKFAENNALSLTDARKLLKADELEEFRWTVEEYIAKGKKNLDGKWERQLVNASARVHISRLETMETVLRGHVEALTGRRIEKTESLLSDLYEGQYLGRAFDLQKGIGVGWDLQRPDLRKLDKVLKTPWAPDGELYSDRIWKDKQALVSELNASLTQGLATGKPLQKIADGLAERLSVKKSAARRLLYTEAAAVTTLAEKDCYRDLDVEEYEILATLDSRTSEICRSMDGQHFPVSEMETGVNAPPFHPNCRTDTCPWFDDWEELGGAPMRAARDAEDKGYKLIPAKMTYKEWEAEFVKAERPYKGVRISKMENTTVPESVREEVNAAIAELEQVFPNILQTVQEIRFGSIPDAFGLDRFSVSRNGEVQHTITFHQDVFSDEEALLQALELDYQSGISYNTDRIESLVAHELGHAAHVELTLQRIGYTGGRMPPEMRRAFVQERNRILQEVYIAAFPDDEFPDITFEEIQQAVEQELGSMAVNNAEELIAQSFGNFYYGKDKSRIAEAIVHFFKEALN